MKIKILILLFAVSNLHAFNADEIRKLADEPHNRENIEEALKLYPQAREYKIKVKSGRSAEESEPRPEIVAAEKIVRGRYLVSHVKLPGQDNAMIRVVGYDKKMDLFKKWVLLPNGIIASSIGVADFARRTIAWTSTTPLGEPPTTVVSLESHSDEKTLWKETFFQDGKIISVTQGEAIKTK